MLNTLVTHDHGHIFTTSLAVAEKFGKKHYNVLRDIQNIIKDCNDNQLRALNFEFTLRNIAGPNHSVRQEPFYNINRDGFSLLAMGFTGQKAFTWKLAFINAFNQMEATLRARSDTEHRALIDGLYRRHPQWRETYDLIQYGFSQPEIALLQGKHPSSVQKMARRMRHAGFQLGVH